MRSGFDDCDVGLTCLFPADADQGRCVPLCGGEPAAPTCEGVDRLCVIRPNQPFGRCQSRCDPLVQDCPEGSNCVVLDDPRSDRFVCVVDRSGDAGAYGDPCEGPDTCDPGLHCVSPDQVPGCSDPAGCCTPFCDLHDDQYACPGAAQGQTCRPVDSEGPGAGADPWGYCGVAP